MGLIRTLLAITVVFAHSDWDGSFVFVGGRNAVEMFYVISGFLIHHVLNNNPAYRDVRRFYVNRALRLYPVYYAAAAVALLVYALVDHDYFARWATFPTAFVLYLLVANVTVIGADYSLLVTARDGGIHWNTRGQVDWDHSPYLGLLLPPTWTLGVELAFYAVAPFILRRARLIVAVFVASLTVRAGLVTVGLARVDPWTYRFFPAELVYFLSGALANRYLLPWCTAIANKHRWVPAAAVAFLGTVIVSYFEVPLPERYKMVVLFALFIPLVSFTFLFQATSHLDRRIGDLSYPIYIGHWLVVAVVGKLLALFEAHFDLFTTALINVAAAIAFAYALDTLVARRIEGRRARIRVSPP